MPLIAYAIENDMVDLLTSEENSYAGNIFLFSVSDIVYSLYLFFYTWCPNKFFLVFLNINKGNIFIHVVIAGGEGLSHTLAGLNMICEKFNQDNVMIIVCLNIEL